MRRAAALGVIVFIVGCGEGPKHLPKVDYQHGKAAFELLEQYDQTSSPSFLMAAAKQLDALPSKTPESDLMEALVNYEISINSRIGASMGIQMAQLSREKIVLDAELGKPSTEDYIKQKAEEVYAAKRQFEEIQPIIKLCRDDAAQYFDASAASTNTCDSELKAYRAKHDKGGESK